MNKIDKEKFLELYADSENTRDIIAEKLGVSLYSVKKFIKENKLTRKPKNSNKKEIDVDLFNKLYGDIRYSLIDIAKELGIHVNNLKKYIKRNNLVRNADWNIDKEEYIRFYIDELHNIDEVMKKFNLNRTQVLKYNKENNIVKSEEASRNTAKRTNLEKYGVEYTGSVPEFRAKREVTNLEKYGYTDPLKNEDVKVRMRNTNLERYGSTSPLGNSNILDKVKDTNLEKYGVENPFQNEEVKEHIKSVNKKRYGVENPMQSELIREKFHNTNLERYGVKHALQNEDILDKLKSSNFDKFGVEYIGLSEELQNRAKATNLERYGVENPLSNKDIFERSRQTLMDNYGVNSPFESAEIREKSKATNLERYGYEVSTKNREVKNKITKSKMYNLENYTEAKKFIESTVSYLEDLIEGEGKKPTYYDISVLTGLDITTVWHRIDRVSAKSLIDLNVGSIMETEISYILKEIKPGIIIENNKWDLISPYEIDIYLPEYKIAIECNPTYTHNSSIGPFSTNNKPKSRSYHKMKTDMCIDKGIFLFHIYGYEWTHNKEILISMFKNMLKINDNKIYARNTIVKEVKPSESTKFLNENHRQGATGGKVKLGLYTKDTDKLVSLMTFSPPRGTLGKTESDNEGSWELIRFCTLKNYNVVGGASKLFKYFIKEYNPEKVKSFSDRSHVSGGLYTKLGFEFTHTTQPNYRWVNFRDDTSYNRTTCQKNKLRKLFKDDTIDIENKTEREIMIEHGYVQVFDSGNNLYTWNKE